MNICKHCERTKTESKRRGARGAKDEREEEEQGKHLIDPNSQSPTSGGNTGINISIDIDIDIDIDSEINYDDDDDDEILGSIHNLSFRIILKIVFVTGIHFELYFGNGL